jgi:AraC-like DNA-binding protein
LADRAADELYEYGDLLINISITTLPSELARAHDRTLSGQHSPEFAHDWHQITMALDGAFVVRNISGAWTTPAGTAVWVPAGARHSVEPLPRARSRTIYLRRDLMRRPRPTCAVLALTPLVKAIADQLTTNGALVEDDATAKRLCQVLVDQVALLAELPLFVPAIRSPLAQRVAAALAADPSDTPRIPDLAGALGVSGRAIERAFLADASMSVGEWRQRSRVCRAIGLLADGMAVKEVALETGYATPTAFITAFKKYVGRTPGKLSA